MEKSFENVVLDIRGQICPACLLITLREINNNMARLRSGWTRLIVKTDHRDATRTIPSAATAMGYDINIVKKEGFYEITIEHKK